MPLYTIPDGNLTRLEERVGKLAKRAVKCHLPPIVFEVLAYEDKPDLDEHGKVSGLTRWYQVRVEGEAPVIAGWHLVAILQPAENSDAMLVRGVPGEEVPLAYRDAPRDWCDHCKVANRGRVKMFVLAHEDGRYVQVGSTCLKSFLGDADPEALAEFAEQILALDDFGAYEDPDFEGGGGGGGRAYVPLADYLSWVARTIRTRGWYSRSKARDMGTSATADDAVAEMWRKYKRYPDDYPLPEDCALAERTIAWVRTELAAKPEKGDYEYNLVIAMVGESMEANTWGLVASAVWSYKQAEYKRLAAAASPSRHVGEPKQQLVLGPLTCTFEMAYDGDYGTTHLHKFVDAAGNVFTWWTSAAVLTTGAQYAGKATIKKHEERDGIPQTMLTNCKFEEVAGE